MSERGAIKYEERYKQLISYEGMERRRLITPTDIDGFIDYNGNAFIMFEGKLIDKSIDYGQKLAFEHLINRLNIPACLLFFRHNSKSNEIIIAKDCIVYEIYFKKEWTKHGNVTVLQCVEQFEQYCTKLGISL